MSSTENTVEEVFRRLDTPLYLATTSWEGTDNAWIINYATRLSLSADPVFMLVCVSQWTFSHELVEKSGALALHLLRKDQWPWIWHFGRQSTRLVDKLRDVSYERRITGSPIITDSIAYLETRILQTLRDVNVGDHTSHIVEVVNWEVFDQSASPLLSVHDAYEHGFA